MSDRTKSWRDTHLRLAAEDDVSGSPMLSDQIDTKNKIKRILSTTLAKALASMTYCPEVHLTDRVADVLHDLESNSDVVVVNAGHLPGILFTEMGATDVVLTRKSILHAAIQALDLSQPLSSIITRIPILPSVAGDDTLETALSRMIQADREEVGVFDQVEQFDHAFDREAKAGVGSTRGRTHRGPCYFDRVFDRVLDREARAWARVHSFVRGGFDRRRVRAEGPARGVLPCVCRGSLRGHFRLPPPRGGSTSGSCI